MKKRIENNPLSLFLSQLNDKSIYKSNTLPAHSFLGFLLILIIILAALYYTGPLGAGIVVLLLLWATLNLIDQDRASRGRLRKKRRGLLLIANQELDASDIRDEVLLKQKRNKSPLTLLVPVENKPLPLAESIDQATRERVLRFSQFLEDRDIDYYKKIDFENKVFQSATGLIKAKLINEGLIKYSKDEEWEWIVEIINTLQRENAAVTIFRSEEA